MAEERATPERDEQIEDLEVPAEESAEVKGGTRKGGVKQQDLVVVKHVDVSSP
jgi:hypothetical protein